MIEKSPKGYLVVSKKTGKKLSKPYRTVTAAKKRLAQVEYFKHQNG